MKKYMLGYMVEDRTHVAYMSTFRCQLRNLSEDDVVTFKSIFKEVKSVGDFITSPSASIQELVTDEHREKFYAKIKVFMNYTPQQFYNEFCSFAEDWIAMPYVALTE